jgi:hypothetical protein
MKKIRTPFLEHPTFDIVLSNGTVTGGVYIRLQNGEPVKCECAKDSQKANITFDLYTRECNHDLAPEAQQRLYDEHKAYIREQFVKAGYIGSIQCTFSDTVIYFDVLLQDAEEWFQKILATLNDSMNLKEI